MQLDEFQRTITRQKMLSCQFFISTELCVNVGSAVACGECPAHAADKAGAAVTETTKSCSGKKWYNPLSWFKGKSKKDCSTAACDLKDK